jgi:fibronectin type 3 domain-containing protein
MKQYPMKMKLLLCLVLMTGLLYNSGVMAQSKKSKTTNGLYMKATVRKSGVLLRWAVDNPGAWKTTNQYGFQLVRYTVVRDGQVLKTPEMKVLHNTPLKPLPLDAWENIVQKDQYAAIIAQAIYGKTFEVSGNSGNKSVATIVAQSAEQEQRFAFSLYAADNSFTAAKMAGWGWEDNTVRPAERYLYRIYSLAPVNKLKIDTGNVYIGMNNYEELPKPGDVGAVFGDKSVMLSWEYNAYKAYYNSWIIEKSLDNGATYQRATSLPVANLNEKDDKPSPRMYYMDSLPDNERICYYRVRGISPFGELGPPSESASGRGRHLLQYVPNIRSNNVDEKGIVTVNWEFEEAGNKFIRGFRLNQAPTASGPYKVVLDNIAPDKRSLQYGGLNATNYFTVTAVAKDDGSTTSFPVLIQPVDSTPPVAPIGLTATIDSSGIVTLKWEKNKEADMLGYAVFRGNNPGEEMSAVTDSVYRGNVFRDSVVVRSLNRKVYYAVKAVDQRYNESPLSAVLEAKKPDVVPPASPVFSGYSVKNDTVYLSWARSADEDVAAHFLYRKTGLAKDTKWDLISHITAPGVYGYSDAAVIGGNTYSYVITAKDSSGLESIPVQPVTVTVPISPSAVRVKAFNAYANRQERYIQVSWNAVADKVAEYQLYKGEQDQPVTLWKVVGADTRSITDQQVKINTIYKYGIRVVKVGGAMGQYQELEVKY